MCMRPVNSRDSPSAGVQSETQCLPSFLGPSDSDRMLESFALVFVGGRGAAPGIRANRTGRLWAREEQTRLRRWIAEVPTGRTKRPEGRKRCSQLEFAAQGGSARSDKNTPRLKEKSRYAAGLPKPETPLLNLFACTTSHACGASQRWDYPGGLKTSDIITIPMRRANSKLPGAVEGRLTSLLRLCETLTITHENRRRVGCRS